MGCFDTVTAKCKCGGRVEWQSKAGECNLDVFSVHQVPLAIAADLIEDTAQCDLCEREYRLNLLFDIQNVPMNMTEVGDSRQ
jgi:hypothetical protein